MIYKRFDGKGSIAENDNIIQFIYMKINTISPSACEQQNQKHPNFKPFEVQKALQILHEPYRWRSTTQITSSFL